MYTCAGVLRVIGLQTDLPESKSAVADQRHQQLDHVTRCLIRFGTAGIGQLARDGVKDLLHFLFPQVTDSCPT